MTCGPNEAAMEIRKFAANRSQKMEIFSTWDVKVIAVDAPKEAVCYRVGNLGTLAFSCILKSSCIKGIFFGVLIFTTIAHV